MPGIGGDRLQGLCGGLKQNAVDNLLILKGDGGDRFRYREDHVKVGNVEQLCLPVLDPLRPCQTLALRAMSIPAAIVGITFMATLVATLLVTSQSRRATQFDGRHDAPLRPRHRRAMLLPIRFPVAAENVRQFQAWVGHDRGQCWGAEGVSAGNRSSGLITAQTLARAIRR